MICDFIFEYFAISFYLNYNNIDYVYTQRHIPAHSGTISNIIFIEDGSKIVTAGRTDGSIIVWKVLEGS
jgi:WD40 repeat protein